jgi:hypothetical protein
MYSAVDEKLFWICFLFFFGKLGVIFQSERTQKGAYAFGAKPPPLGKIPLSSVKWEYCAIGGVDEALIG